MYSVRVMIPPPPESKGVDTKHIHLRGRRWGNQIPTKGQTLWWYSTIGARSIPLPVRRSRVLPVQVQAVEAVVGEQVHGGLDEAAARLGRGRHLRVLLAALIPAANGEHHAQPRVQRLQRHGGLVGP
jgi:hypothetical protein